MFRRCQGAQRNVFRLERDFCQPKIENLRLTSIRDEDVRGLDVPMDDALGVCRVESIGNLDAQIEHRFDLQRLATYHVPKRLPLQQFHGDEGSPIGLVDLVDRADVRVIQGGRGLGLTLEATESLWVVGEVVGKELQGDVAVPTGWEGVDTGENVTGEIGEGSTSESVRWRKTNWLARSTATNDSGASVCQPVPTSTY
jgi:hypothetical protein